MIEPYAILPANHGFRALDKIPCICSHAFSASQSLQKKKKSLRNKQLKASHLSSPLPHHINPSQKLHPPPPNPKRPPRPIPPILSPAPDPLPHPLQRPLQLAHPLLQKHQHTFQPRSPSLLPSSTVSRRRSVPAQAVQTIGEPGVAGVCGQAVGVKAGVAGFVRGEDAEAAGVVVMMVVVMVAVGGTGLSNDGFVVGRWREAFWSLGVGYTASNADIHFEAQSGFGGHVEG